MNDLGKKNFFIYNQFYTNINTEKSLFIEKQNKLNILKVYKT